MEQRWFADTGNAGGRTCIRVSSQGGRPNRQVASCVRALRTGGFTCKVISTPAQQQFLVPSRVDIEIGLRGTGWTLADPLIAAAIGLFIVPRTWRLLREAVHILIEGVPAEVDLNLLEESLRQIPGVYAVHELHVWTTSGLDSMNGHLVVENMAEAPRVIRAARQVLRDRFGLDHVTVQIENEELRAEETILPVIRPREFAMTHSKSGPGGTRYCR